jgi:chemotaxis signal transduction protein
MNDDSHIENKQDFTQIQFLEQLSEQEFWDYARSQAAEEARPQATHEEYLECITDQGHYLFALRMLSEVVPPPHKLTLLPLCPTWMLGITAWRGHIIPVVDLASYFTSYEKNETDTMHTQSYAYPRSSSTVLILDDGNTLLGIQVAAVGSIIDLEQAQLVSPEQAPSWYPQRLLTTLLGVYNEALVLNLQVLILEMMQHIKVSAAYE